MIAVEHLARAFLEGHPARAARRLERMRAGEAAAVLAAVSARTAAAVLQEMAVPIAADSLQRLAPRLAAAIVDEMATTSAAAIVRSWDPEVRRPLLDALAPEVREPVSRSLAYPPGTAGSVMDPAIFQLPEDVLVAEGRARLGRADRGLLYYVYIVDGRRRLVGVLDIAELLFARPRERVSAVMHRNVDRLSAWVPVALVREHRGWQDYHAIPVVDDEDRLLGAIRYQTLRRLEREASDHDPDPGQVTAGALAELFQLGTRGLAGIGGAAPTEREAVRPAGDDEGARHGG